MAADKALIAGAAKVAGAKAKLDTATLSAFTDLGEDIGQYAQNILATMQKNEEARNEAINEGLSTINSQSIKPSNDIVGGMFDTPSVQEFFKAPINTLTKALNVQGANFNYDTEITQNQDVMDQQKKAQIMQNVVTSETEKRNNYLTIVQEPGFKYNLFYDTESEEGKAAQAYLDGTAKWESKESGRDPNSFGYKVNNKFYTTAQMQKIVNNAIAPDNLKEVFNFLDNSSKRSFSAATNNAEADQISKRISNEILSDENTLNNFLVYRTGRSLQTLKKQKNFKAEDEVNEFIKEQRAMHYDEPKVEAEKPDKPRLGEDYYNETIKTIDELPNSINPAAFKLSSKKDYYLSTLFTDNLPERYITSGDFDEDGDLVIVNQENNEQITIKENEPLSAVKAKLKTIASGRKPFFTQ